MHFETSIVTSAVWLFVFRKVPSWKWFKAILPRTPASFREFWGGWTGCAYCSGFWIALLLRWATGLRTLATSASANPPLDWVIDALTTGILVLLFIRALDSLAVVAEMRKDH